MPYLINLFMLGIASTVVICATGRHQDSFGTGLWRSWLIANLAVYVSLVATIFAQYGVQWPSGPENVYAVFVLLPLQGLVVSAVIVQPVLFMACMIGLAVFMPMIYLFTPGSPVTPSAPTETTYWSKPNIALGLSTLVICIGYTGLTLRERNKAKVFHAPHVLERSLINLRDLEMTEFTSHGTTKRTRNDTGQMDSIQGTCQLTDSAVRELLDRYEWAPDPLGKSDNRIVAHAFTDWISSEEFDSTFEVNPEYRFGNAFLDTEHNILYFKADGPEIPYSTSKSSENVAEPNTNQ